MTTAPHDAGCGILPSLERAGYCASLRPDGYYEVRNIGTLHPFEVVDLWVRLKCWPTPVEFLPQIMGRPRLQFGRPLPPL